MKTINKSTECVLSNSCRMEDTDIPSTMAKENNSYHSPLNIMHSSSSEQGDDSGVTLSNDNYNPFTSFDVQIPFHLVLLLLFSAAAQSFYATMMSLMLSKEVGYGPLDITRYWMYISVCSWISPFISHRLCGIYLKGKKALMISVTCCGIIAMLFGMFSITTNHVGIFLFLSVYSQLCLASQYTLLTEYVVEAGRCESGESSLVESSRQTQLLSQAMVWRSVGTVMGAIIQAYGLFFWSIRLVLVGAGVLFFILLPLVYTLPLDIESLRNENANGAHAPEQRFRDSAIQTLSIIHRSIFRNYSGISIDEQRFVCVLGFVLLFTMMPDSSNVYYNYLFSYRFSSWMYPVLNGIGYCGSTFGAYVFSYWMNRRERSSSKKFNPSNSAVFVFAIGILFWICSHICNVLLMEFIEHHCATYIGRNIPDNALHLMPVMYVSFTSFLMAMFSRLSFLPTMVISSVHTPPRYQSLSNDVFGLVATIGGFLSALSTHIVVVVLYWILPQSPLMLLTWTIVICGLAKLFLLPLVYLLLSYDTPDAGGREDVKQSSSMSQVQCFPPSHKRWDASIGASECKERTFNNGDALTPPERRCTSLSEDDTEFPHTSSSSSGSFQRRESDVIISDDGVTWEGFVFRVPENYARCTQPSE